ncbi:MAG: glycosyltransferase family 87 protein [Solirubrobacteraceae bacterium]
MSVVAQSRDRIKALDHALLVLPFAVTLWLLHLYVTMHSLGVDFQHAYRPAGVMVLHGRDPYRWSAAQIRTAEVFVYPAPAALLLAPLALLGSGLGDALFIAAQMVALVAALRLLSVRDWRIYAVAFLWWPVVNAWQTANLTLLFCLALAVAWRYRDRPVLAGLVTALAVSLKPFLWPLGLWMLATRRYRAAAWAVAFELVLNGVAWAILGFGAVSAYLHLSGRVIGALYRTGYGIIALLVHVGATRSAGSLALVVVSIAIVAACLIAGWRGRDQSAFALAVALMLVASPLVWNHYFALLIVPLAIARPYLSPVWIAPLILWLCPATDVSLWQAALAWGVTCAVIWWLVRMRTLATLDGVPPGAGAARSMPAAELGRVA